MTAWYEHQLVCPRDHSTLVSSVDRLVCLHGHEYPVVDGVPVMLLDGDDQTMTLSSASLDRAWGRTPGDPRAPDLYLESLGVSESEKDGIAAMHTKRAGGIDPVVAYLVAATNGLMYKELIGNLSSYPIPDLRLPPGEGRTLVDIGCNWGRWSVAAARRGYSVTGIDPSLGAVLAGRRVARELGVEVRFVVGDGRHLPFAPASIHQVFSYSVLQHLSRPNVRSTLRQIARILAPGGSSLVQMPNRLGVRCLYHQARRGFREARDFEVRYWTRGELLRTFEEAIGRSEIEVDCFFGIGLQMADAPLMSSTKRAILRTSEALRGLSAWIPALTSVADSLYIRSHREA